ncbi:MAG TPA: AMIN domain-containing protein, partial [bacterium]|nr:AMIN domain-containing protein [bacterium]
MATILFSLVFLAKTPVAHAGPAEDAYAQAQVAYRELMAMPEEKKKFRHHWQSVIDKFKAISEKYPKSNVADSALFTEGKLYYELYDISRLKDDLRNAATAWNDCAEKYPKSHVADDSLFWAAKAQHVLGYHDKEVADLQMLLEKYPKSEMVKDARKALAKIEADGEAKVASATPAATPTAVAVSTPEPQPTPTPPPRSTPVAVAIASGTPAAVIAPDVTSGGDAGENQAIHKVKVISDAGYTRVVIYAGGEVHWEAHQIKADGDKPPRVYVDLTNAHVGEDLKKDAPRLEKMWEIPIEDGLLKRARVAQNDGETVRVVLDLGAITKWRITPFDDPFRLIFDFYGAGGAPVAVAGAEPQPSPASSAVAVATPEGATPVPSATPEAGATPSLTPEQLAKLKDAASKRAGGISLSAQLGLKVARIYIDAGHGG